MAYSWIYLSAALCLSALTVRAASPLSEIVEVVGQACASKMAGCSKQDSKDSPCSQVKAAKSCLTKENGCTEDNYDKLKYIFCFINKYAEQRERVSAKCKAHVSNCFDSNRPVKNAESLSYSAFSTKICNTIEGAETCFLTANSGNVCTQEEYNGFKSVICSDPSSASAPAIAAVLLPLAGLLQYFLRH